MKKNISIYRLAALFIIVTLVSGCNFNSPKSPKKEGTKVLTFTDSSNGLPATGKWRETIDIYDLNGDGHLDILAPPPRLPSKEADRRPHVWYGNGKGEWSEGHLSLPPGSRYAYGGICAGDFDADKIPDMALAMHSLGLKALKGDGRDGYVELSGELPTVKEFTSRALVSADFNNDGIPDIASVSELSPRRRGVFSLDGCIWVCLRSEEGWKCNPVGQEEVKGKGGLIADKIATGDANGDGNMDIGVASLNHEKSHIVWFGDGKGGFTSFDKGLTSKVHYQSVAFADLNNDGKDDLIASVTGFGREGIRAIKAFLSEKEGFREMSGGLPEKEVFFSVKACDLDGDGTVEIVGGTAEGGVKIFSRKEDQWYEVKVSGLPEKGLQRIYDVYCRDLNRDGYKDIVVNYSLGGSNNDGGIRVFLGVPDKDS